MPTIKMYGANWCPDCQRAKSYLDKHEIDYQFIDIDKEEDAASKVEEMNEGKRIIPTFDIDGAIFANPDNNQLRETLDIDESDAVECYDVVVVGAGAAGLTTSIYTQRERLSTIILEKQNIGGNAYLTDKIENYPGFKDISGPDLMNRMADQTRTYGTDIRQGSEVTEISKNEHDFTLQTNMGAVRGKTVVIATGSTYKTLNIPGEEELIGAGIHFCATCDGPFYKDKDVVVIGGGNTAVEESIYLAEFCKSVTIVNKNESFSASPTAIDKMQEYDNIQPLYNRDSLAFLSDNGNSLDAVKVKNNETDEEETIEAQGAFVFIGLTPNTDFLEGFVERDEHGFVVTESGSVRTSVPGVFVAGDCRKGATTQIAAATGEGVVASYCAKEHLMRMKNK